MRPGKSIAIVFLASALAVFAVTALVVAILYDQAFEQKRALLVRMAESQANLLDSVIQGQLVAARDSAQPLEGPAGLPMGAVVELFEDAHRLNRFVDETGEFVLGRREGDRIDFLLRHSFLTADQPMSVPFSSEFAEPMRLALMGQSGSVVGLDYRGAEVLAAYETVSGANMGIVTKIDVEEIRAPYIRGGLVVGFVLALLIGPLAYMVLRVNLPMMQRVAESERRYKSLVQSSPFCVHEIDLEGRLMSMNPAGLQMMGVKSEQDIVGLDYLSVPDEKDFAHVEALMDKARNGEGSVFEFRATGSGGALNYLSSFEPIRDENGRITHLMGITQDITERKQLEAQFLQAQKMEAVGQLTGGIAHDFNNLLAAMLLNMEMLSQEVGDNSGAAAYVDTTLSSIDHAATLTSRLLAFARQQQFDLEETSVSDQLQAFLPLIGRLLGEKVKIAANIEAVLWPVLIDRHQLESALLNLCINARDAMPEGGILELGAENSHFSHPLELSQGRVEPGDYVCISVRDTGIGMSAETMEHALEPFFTTKGIGKGTGLGLSMVYGFVYQSDGHLDIQSEEGVGTTFRLYFPKYVQEAARSA